MLQSVGGNHNIPDIDLRLQGACDARIDQPVHIEYVHQNLGAEACVHLTDTASYHDYLTAAQQSLIKLHGRFLYHDLYFHLFF